MSNIRKKFYKTYTLFGLALTLALLITAFTSSAAQAGATLPIPQVTTGKVGIYIDDLGLQGTITQRIRLSVAKTCGTDPVYKRKVYGLQGVRTSQGAVRWNQLETRHTVCHKAGSSKWVIVSGNGGKENNSPWKASGSSIAGAVTVIDSFARYHREVTGTAAVEVTVTSPDGSVGRCLKQVNASTMLFGHDIADAQGSATAVDAFLKSTLSEIAAGKARDEVKKDSSCSPPAKVTNDTAPESIPTGTTPVATTPTPDYPPYVTPPTLAGPRTVTSAGKNGAPDLTCVVPTQVYATWRYYVYCQTSDSASTGKANTLLSENDLSPNIGNGKLSRFTSSRTDSNYQICPPNVQCWEAEMQVDVVNNSNAGLAIYVTAPGDKNKYNSVSSQYTVFALPQGTGSSMK